jgi:hypothetical protein
MCSVETTGDWGLGEAMLRRSFRRNPGASDGVLGSWRGFGALAELRLPVMSSLLFSFPQAHQVTNTGVLPHFDPRREISFSSSIYQADLLGNY